MDLTVEAYECKIHHVCTQDVGKTLRGPPTLIGKTEQSIPRACYAAHSPSTPSAIVHYSLHSIHKGAMTHSKGTATTNAPKTWIRMIMISTVGSLFDEKTLKPTQSQMTATVIMVDFHSAPVKVGDYSSMRSVRTLVKSSEIPVIPPSQPRKLSEPME